MKYTRIHRLLHIITLIQSEKGWTARRLAEACETTPRNIYRDLKMIEGAGVPCYYENTTRGYRIAPGFFLPPLEFTMDEALALIAVAQKVGEQDQIALMQPLVRAAAKIRSQLPPALRDQLDDLKQRIEIQLSRAMGPEGIEDVYHDIQIAIHSRKALRCEYDTIHRRGGTPQNQDPFLFHPYCLLWGQRAWYAIGHHDGRGEIRCLKLNRFTRVSLTEIPYTIPKKFSLSEYLGKAWRMMPGSPIRQVELWFDAEFADTVSDTHWHSTQEIEWQEDGSMLLRYEVAGLDEIVWWILSMGPHCVVRQPKALADRVRNLAAEIVSRYTGKP